MATFLKIVWTVFWPIAGFISGSYLGWQYNPIGAVVLGFLGVFIGACIAAISPKQVIAVILEALR